MTTEQLEAENKRIHDKIDSEAKAIATACLILGAVYIGVIGLFLFGVSK